ncbi:hypothetical protein AR685_05280 [Chryseobacterium sp. JAH]|nr:hypothetical protein AR685_05280 [Chryseobacterium sp. JAH]
MKKKFRIIACIFFLTSILVFLLTFTFFKFNFIEVKIPGKSEINLDKGAYTVYLMNDNYKESNYQNYFFELKDVQNRIVRKFPDSLNPKWISTTDIIRIKDKKYTSYSEFNISHEGKYFLKSYSKNNHIKEVTILKDEHVNSRIILFYIISIICLFLSFITLIISFFLKK